MIENRARCRTIQKKYDLAIVFSDPWSFRCLSEMKVKKLVAYSKTTAPKSAYSLEFLQISCSILRGK